MSTQLQEATSGPTRVPPLRRAFSLFRAAPWFFLAFQLPQACDELIEGIFVPSDAKSFQWQILALMPFLYVINMLSTALTFVSVQQIDERGTFSLKEAWKRVRNRSGLLIATSLVIGFLVSVGLLAMVIPGIYLTAIYLFVPYLILSEAPVAFSAYLNQSTKLSKQNLKESLGFATLGFGFSILQLILENLDFPASLFTSSNGTLMTVLSIGFRMILAIAAGAFLDLWVSAFYLSLKRRA